jgi:NADH:ubiquinone oxidoreductase subunit B-like Fe-S oxidoreductase
MTTPRGAIPLGAERASGGYYHAQWSVRAGRRVNIVIPAEAYAEGALAHLGEHLVDKLGAPHGIVIAPSQKGIDT